MKERILDIAHIISLVANRQAFSMEDKVPSPHPFLPTLEVKTKYTFSFSYEAKDADV